MACRTYGVGWSTSLYLEELTPSSQTDTVNFLNVGINSAIRANLEDVLSVSTEFCWTKCEEVETLGLPPSIIYLSGAFGNVQGKALPPHKCINLRLIQSAFGGRSHGTMRISGLPDADNDGNLYLEANHQVAWNAIRNFLINDFLPGGGEAATFRFMVRSKDPSPGPGDPEYRYTPITDALVSPFVHNMRLRTSRHDYVPQA